MISGVAVTVHRHVQQGVDRFNNAVYSTVDETVGNVLVSPGATDALSASRPEGVSVAYTLHFPKGYSSDLEGCTVTLPDPWGGEYAVIGKPSPYIDANTPTPWHMPVELEAAHG